MNRYQFKSIWNGTATIIFFAGIFLGYDEIAGQSTFGIAIFMWIIGGTVRDMIYGSKKSKRKSSYKNDRKIETKDYDADKFCSACGERNKPDAEFCIECGSSISPEQTTPSSDSSDGMDEKPAKQL